MSRFFPYPVHDAVLGNGLRVLTVPMDSPGLAAHYVVVRTGSRNEIEPGLSGFAHFFEHMMFRGTERYSAEAYNDAVRAIGADANAFTTDDWTCYHVTCGPSDLDTVMELEADRFMNLRYDLEAFQKEAGAVLGEYNKNYAEPLNALIEKLQDTAYDLHPYKHTTMGFLRDIERMPQRYDYSLEFFRRWYRPDNAILIVVGDVRPDAVLASAERRYGGWRGGAASLVTPVEPRQSGERRAHLPWKNATLPYLAAGWHVPGFDAGSVEGRALEVLAAIAFGVTSPFRKAMVLERGWVETLWAGAEALRDPSLFLVVARVKAPAFLASVRDAIFGVLDRIAHDPPPASRVAAVVDGIRYGFLQQLDTPDHVAAALSRFSQLTGEPAAIDRTFETLGRVTPREVRDAAAAWLSAWNRTVVTLAHESEVLPERGEDVPIPPPSEARTFAFPVPPESPHSTAVESLPIPGSPLVAFRILFACGSADDPSGKEGLAALTAAVLAEGGTRRLTAAELLEASEPMAASIAARVDKEMTVFEGTVHVDHAARFFELLRQVVVEPRFEPADFERLRIDQANAITAGLRASDDENLGKETLSAAIHAGGPYGHPVVGTTAALASMTLADAREFWSRHYVRERCTLGVAGSWAPESIAAAARALGCLGDGSVPPRVVPRPRRPEGIELTVVTKPCRAWAISIGFPLEVTRADDDFYRLYVAGSYLGEHRTFNGVLMNKIRADRGLNYGDYAYVEAFVQDGMSTFPRPNLGRSRQDFSIWIRPVAGPHAFFAIRCAFRELRRLVDHGIPPDEFEATRRFLLRYAPLWTQTPGRRLGYRMDGAYYRRASLAEELQRRLPGMSAEEVHAAIRRHLLVDAAHVAVVADPEGASSFAEAFVAGTPSPVRYDTATRETILVEDREIAVYPLRANAARTRLLPAFEIF